MDILHTLEHLVVDLSTLVVELLALALRWSLVIAWIAWWLWGVNWKKVWPALAIGGWVPFVLLIVLGALAWSQLEPVDCNCLGFVRMPNFWWQLGGVGLLAAITLFCGWLQGVFGWEPEEVNLEPPAASTQAHDHHH